jgi:hypothetical protein
MKTLIATLTLAALIIGLDFTSSASATSNPRHDSTREQHNYDPIYKGYPLSHWYLGLGHLDRRQLPAVQKILIVLTCPPARRGNLMVTTGKENKRA